MAPPLGITFFLLMFGSGPTMKSFVVLAHSHLRCRARRDHAASASDSDSASDSASTSDDEDDMLTKNSNGQKKRARSRLSKSLRFKAYRFTSSKCTTTKQFTNSVAMITINNLFSAVSDPLLSWSPLTSRKRAVLLVRLVLGQKRLQRDELAVGLTH